MQVILGGLIIKNTSDTIWQYQVDRHAKLGPAQKSRAGIRLAYFSPNNKSGQARPAKNAFSEKVGLGREISGFLLIRAGLGPIVGPTVRPGFRLTFQCHAYLGPPRKMTRYDY